MRPSSSAPIAPEDGADVELIKPDNEIRNKPSSPDIESQVCQSMGRVLLPIGVVFSITLSLPPHVEESEQRRPVSNIEASCLEILEHHVCHTCTNGGICVV
jgi:hypothetical protein